MKCAHLEALLCDYVDGTLPEGQRREVERHLAQCAACAELARDDAAAVAFMEQAPKVEPPPELITRILYALPAAREARLEPSPSLGGRLGRLFRPMLQPRFAMGFAMTVLSFSMLGKFAGISVRQLSPSDLNPVKLWQALDDRLHRAWDRSVKFYEGLRLVYEIRSRVRELTEQEQQPQAVPAEEPPASSAEPPTRTSPDGARRS